MRDCLCVQVPLLSAGAVKAAVHMLQLDSTASSAQEGASKAASLLLFFSGLVKAETIHQEPGVLDALHSTAKGRHGADAAQAAQKCLSQLMERMHRAGVQAPTVRGKVGVDDSEDEDEEASS